MVNSVLQSESLQSVFDGSFSLHLLNRRLSLLQWLGENVNKTTARDVLQSSTTGLNVDRASLEDLWPFSGLTSTSPFPSEGKECTVQSQFSDCNKSQKEDLIGKF